MTTKLLLCGFLILTFFTGFSQLDQNIKSESAVKRLFDQKLQGSSKLYSGPEYIEQTYRMIGNQFFISDSLVNGWVSYGGHLYTDIPMQWDLLQDYVIIKSLRKEEKLVLRNDLIDSFYLSGHLVKNMEADKNHNLLRAGFYDILYTNKTAVIAMRKKETLGIIQGVDVFYNFSAKDKIYVKKEGTYYLINNKKDIVKLFSNKRAAIKRLVRKEGLNWRKNLDQCVVVAAQYYDNFTH
ncbi:MAG: hypothetical protein ABI204_03975 [Ginsengibacter sp.]